MSPRMRKSLIAAAAVALLSSGLAQAPASAQAAAVSDWRAVAPANLLVIDTDKGRILVELTPLAAPNHV